MAVAHRRVHIANPARRRKLSDKQIRIFGSKAQKAALKRRRSAKAHRSRTRPRSRKNMGELVSLALGAANPARKRKAAKKAMAKTHRRAKRVTRARSTPRRRRRTVVHHRRRSLMRSNPQRTRRRRSNPVTHRRRHSYRRNPLGAGWVRRSPKVWQSSPGCWARSTSPSWCSGPPIRASWATRATW